MHSKRYNTRIGENPFEITCFFIGIVITLKKIEKSGK